MQAANLFKAWARILAGRTPALSIELTRECPLRCPGCYAYEDGHLGAGVTLRQLADYKGDVLVRQVLQLVDEHRPVHLSLVGGDPLVRYRELEELLPELELRGIHVQLVTSAFRPIPARWGALSRLNVAVSVDGLQPEHDARRKPATYDRILKNIAGTKVTIHCTITAQMLRRPGYLEDFARFWSERPETKRIWFSIFTPQKGEIANEILTADQRRRAIEDLTSMRATYPLVDMPAVMIEEFRRPPASPRDCIFARTTLSISADLKTRITPCQFGGNPDCSQCGCAASMGMAAVGHHKLLPGLTVGAVFAISDLIGSYVGRQQARKDPKGPLVSPEAVDEQKVA